MNLRATSAMAVVLIALCAAYYGLQQFEGGAERRAEEAKRKYDFDAPTIASLSLQQLVAPAVQADQTEPGVWQITQPNPTIRPLPQVWDRIAQNFAQLLNERTLGAVDQPAEYGLAEPILQVRATLRDGTTHDLRFGFEDPTQTFRYAQDGGGEVFLVKTAQFFELNRSLEDVRHRFLVQNREANILRFEFARIWTGDGGDEIKDPPAIGSESVRIVAARPEAQQPWAIIEPEAAPADQEVLNALLGELQFGVGENFNDKPQPLTEYGLDPPRARITVVDDRSGTPQTLFLGNVDESLQKGRVFAKLEGQDAIFTVDGHIISLLPRSPHALRERRLVARSFKELSAVDYREGDTRFTLALTEKGWRLTDPDEETNQMLVSGFLSGLRDIAGVGFPVEPAAALGLDEPDYAITLHFSDGDPIDIRFRQSPRDPAYVYATQWNGTPVLLESARAEFFRLSRADLLSGELLRFEARQAASLNLTFDGVPYAFEKVHGQWLVRQPAGKVLANQTDAENILRAFTPLTGKGADGPEASDLAVTGLGSPLCTFEARLVDPTTGVEGNVGPVLIGQPMPSDPLRRYCRIPGRDVVYLIQQEVVETIREALQGVVDQP